MSTPDQTPSDGQPQKKPSPINYFEFEVQSDRTRRPRRRDIPNAPPDLGPCDGVPQEVIYVALVRGGTPPPAPQPPADAEPKP